MENKDSKIVLENDDPINSDSINGDSINDYSIQDNHNNDYYDDPINYDENDAIPGPSKIMSADSSLEYQRERLASSDDLTVDEKESSESEQTLPRYRCTSNRRRCALGTRSNGGTVPKREIREILYKSKIKQNEAALLLSNSQLSLKPTVPPITSEERQNTIFQRLPSETFKVHSIYSTMEQLNSMAENPEHNPENDMEYRNFLEYMQAKMDTRAALNRGIKIIPKKRTTGLNRIGGGLSSNFSAKSRSSNSNSSLSNISTKRPKNILFDLDNNQSRRSTISSLQQNSKLNALNKELVQYRGGDDFYGSQSILNEIQSAGKKTRKKPELSAKEQKSLQRLNKYLNLQIPRYSLNSTNKKRITRKKTVKRNPIGGDLLPKCLSTLSQKLNQTLKDQTYIDTTGHRVYNVPTYLTYAGTASGRYFAGMAGGKELKRKKAGMAKQKNKKYKNGGKKKAHKRRASGVDENVRASTALVGTEEKTRASRASFGTEGKKRASRASFGTEGHRRASRASFGTEGKKRASRASFGTEGHRRASRASFGTEGKKRASRASVGRASVSSRATEHSQESSRNSKREHRHDLGLHNQHEEKSNQLTLHVDTYRKFRIAPISGPFDESGPYIKIDPNKRDNYDSLFKTEWIKPCLRAMQKKKKTQPELPQQPKQRHGMTKFNKVDAHERKSLSNKSELHERKSLGNQQISKHIGSRPGGGGRKRKK